MKKLFLALMLFISFSAQADLYDIAPVRAVMKKKYSNRSEFTMDLGYMPVGSLSKYIAAGGAYSWAFDDNHAWEVVNAQYTLEMKTALKRELTAPLPEGYGVDSAGLAALKFLVTSNYIFSPLYTKSLLFNSSVIHTQTSFALGGGIGQFNIGSVPTMDLGLIERFFTGHGNQIKFDFRYYAFFSSQDTVKNNVSLNLGYAWGFE